MSLAKATDIAIGLILTILIVSALCSGANEAIAWMFKQRSKGLWKAIAKLVEAAGTVIPSNARPHPGGPAPAGLTVTQALYDSPFVEDAGRVARDGKTLIGHLASSEFSQGLVHAALAAPAAATAAGNTVDKIAAGLGLNSEVGKVVNQLKDEVGGDVEKLRSGIEGWFNAQMARLARVYRNKARIFAFFIGLVIAIAANVDLVFITRQLNSNDVLRASAGTVGAQVVANCKGKTGDDLTKCITDKTTDFTLPIGWASSSASSFSGWNKAWKPIGWLLTAFAAMWGAPFWFDLLKRITGVRTGSGSGGSSASSP